MDETKLLRKVCQGNQKAFVQIMERYTAYVAAIIYGIIGQNMSTQDVEEVVSDVFLAAWNQAEQIRPGVTKAWLGAVARNMAKNKLRHMGQELPFEEDYLEIPGENTPATEAERKEEFRLVRKAVDTMGEPDREVFLRHYYYAQTVQEISQAMHLKEATIKTKLRRGRMRLRTTLLRWDVI